MRRGLPSVPDRPLDPVASIKLKLALLVGVSILVATVVAGIGEQSEVPWWVSLPVTLAAALGVTQWLARGMTSPLREMTAVARRMASGDYTQRVTATATDEVGTLARAFNTMAGDLRAADAQRRQLIATVSHELRTPLAAQRALLENLVDGVAAPDAATLGTALDQAERMSDLVADLLDLSRIESGQSALRSEPVIVAELLARAVAEAGLTPREVGHDVCVEPEGLTVEADPSRLAQVVANLLDNAGRHSPAGGRVGIRAYALDADRWALEVLDEGPGIPADRADAVFERFGTGSDAAGGTGLGLAIARWVCELHGGTICVAPTAATAHGACIRAVLPRHTAPGALPPPPAHSTVTTEEPAVPSTPTTSAPVPTPYAAPAAPSPFAELWPERGIAPQPGLLGAALAVGLLGALSVPYHPIGLAVLVTLDAGGAVVWRVSAARTRPWTLVSGVLALALGSLIVVRSAPWIAVLAMLVAGVLAATALTRARGLIAIVAGPVAWVLAGLRGLPLLGRTLTAMSRRRLLWPVVRTVAVSAVLLVVFGALFASGDAVFGAWADALVPNLDITGFTFRTFVFVLVGGVVLAGAYLALNPPRLDALALPPGRPVARAWEWLVPVATVDAVFALFLLAQAAALVGGHDYVQRTTGLTYADSVHQGFGQLSAATALTLIVVAVTVRKAPVDTARSRLLLRITMGLLGGMTLLVVASALHRMAAYQEAYGFTTLRLVVDAFELWLGLLVVLALIAVLRLGGRWLPRTALLSGAAVLLVLGLMNPAGWVARHNIERYEAGRPLDAGYLVALGEDALPTVLAADLPRDVKACAVGLVTRDRYRLEHGLLAWNLGRSRADSAIQGAGIAGLAPTGPTCTALFDGTEPASR